MNRCLVIGIGSVGHAVFQKVQFPFPYMYFMPTQKQQNITNWHFAKFQFKPNDGNYFVGKRGILHYYNRQQELDIEFFQLYDEAIVFGGVGGSAAGRILVDMVDFLHFMNYKVTVIAQIPTRFESNLRQENAKKVLESLPLSTIKIENTIEYMPTKDLYALADEEILATIRKILTVKTDIKK